MAVFAEVKGYVEKHPAVAGIGAFVIGLGLLYFLGFFSSSSSSSGSSGSTALDQAYYGAEAAQAAASASTQNTQTEANAATAQTLITTQGAVAQTGLVTAAATQQNADSVNATTQQTETAANQSEFEALVPLLASATVPSGGSGATSLNLSGIPGLGNIVFNSGAGGPTPNQLIASGFSASQVNTLEGFGS